MRFLLFWVCVFFGVWYWFLLRECLISVCDWLFRFEASGYCACGCLFALRFVWVVGCGFVGANCVTIWLLWCLLVVCVYGSGCRLRVVVMRWCLRLRGFCAALYVGWFAFSVVAMALVYVLVWLGAVYG